MIRGSDGLDYEDLTARLLGEPNKTPRNQAILTARHTGHPALADYLADIIPDGASHYTCAVATDAYFAGFAGV